MSEHLAAVRNFLEQRHLSWKIDACDFAKTRSLLEQSPLLQTVDETCAAFNREAGSTVVEGHAYFSPEPVIRSFTFVKGRTEYVMRLDLWGTKPVLCFIRRRGNATSFNPFVRWIYRVVELDRLGMNTVFVGEIKQESVSEAAVQRWFFYLLSSFNRSYIPPLKRIKISMYQG